MHEIRTQGPVEAVMEVYTDFFMYASGVYQVHIHICIDAKCQNAISSKIERTIAENKSCTGSSCRLSCCQDHWVGTGRKIQPFAFICNPTTQRKVQLNDYRMVANATGLLQTRGGGSGEKGGSLSKSLTMMMVMMMIMMVMMMIMRGVWTLDWGDRGLFM